jgi:predicted RNase H-like nuclease
MGDHLGVDWASNGWVAAARDENGKLAVGFYPTVWNLWHERETDAEQVLIDIPIGLPEDGRRECDREAKRRLGDRWSSVFWTPIRDAVYEDDIEAAKAVQESVLDHSISNQAWAIVPRIRELDVFLRETEEARGLVRESHPEICFDALADGERIAPKSDGGGIETRRELLCEELEVEEEELERTVRTLTEPKYAPRAGTDDVLDAIVLAATAKSVADGEYSTLQADPPKDRVGLPMEIVAPER